MAHCTSGHRGTVSQMSISFNSGITIMTTRCQAAITAKQGKQHLISSDSLTLTPHNHPVKGAPLCFHSAVKEIKAQRGQASTQSPTASTWESQHPRWVCMAGAITANGSGQRGGYFKVSSCWLTRPSPVPTEMPMGKVYPVLMEKEPEDILL